MLRNTAHQVGNFGHQLIVHMQGFLFLCKEKAVHPVPDGDHWPLKMVRVLQSHHIFESSVGCWAFNKGIDPTSSWLYFLDRASIFFEENARVVITLNFEHIYDEPAVIQQNWFRIPRQKIIGVSDRRILVTKILCYPKYIRATPNASFSVHAGNKLRIRYI